jgi:anti-sigma B factor antagonist
VRISHEGVGTIVLGVVGEIDLGTAARLEQAVADALNVPGTEEVRVDLSRVSFMDSTGLRVLISGMLSARQTGLRFTMADPQPHLLRVMRVTGIDTLLGLPAAES